MPKLWFFTLLIGFLAGMIFVGYMVSIDDKLCNVAAHRKMDIIATDTVEVTERENPLEYGLPVGTPLAPIGNFRQITDVEWLGGALRGLKFDSSEFCYVVDAAKRNRCWTLERLALLLAIRRQEAGGPGIEYGIVCQRGSSYRVQAGWCAATISKFLDARRVTAPNDDDIRALAFKYTPEDRPEIWHRNVEHWYRRICVAMQSNGLHQPVWDKL